MKEVTVQPNVTNLISKDIEKERKNNPICLCGNQIKPILLKMDKMNIYYGICEKCDRLNFYKEFLDLNQSKYQQTWQKIPTSEIKKEIEEFLYVSIPDNTLETHSTDSAEIISKVKMLHEIKQLIKISSISQS